MRSISLTLIGITILMLGVIGPVRGTVTVLESGYRLQGCGIFGCSDSTACGTEATITPSYSQINNPQDSVAYFTSIDYVDSSNNHYWAQAGYVIGYAPPTGLHYSQPEIYFETNGLYYSFTAIESASWNYPITFQVWIKSFIANGNQNDPIFTLSINGANLPGYDAEFPSGFAKGGTVNDFVEVHQSSGQIDLATASWSNLMAQDIDPGSQPPWDGFCHPLAGWASWSHSYVLHQDTPYYLNSGSVTSFSTWTATAVPQNPLSANPSSVTFQQGYGSYDKITVNSNGGYVSLTAQVSATQCGFTATFDGASSPSGCLGVNGGSSVTISAPFGSTTLGLAIIACLATSPGTYTVHVTVMGITGFPTSTLSIDIPVTVTRGPGCDSGSVAAGTLITLADGTQVPVERLKAGMQLLSYDMTMHQFVHTSITQFVTVTVHNLMTVRTADGHALTTDQNPRQTLYAMFPDGTWKLVPVTELQVGYKLFDPIAGKWIPITHIHYKNHGTYIMYDIYNTSPRNYIANGYLDPNK